MKRLVICGQDGVGKTTLLNKYMEYLELLGIDCRIVHFYHDNLLFKLLKKMGVIRPQLPEIENQKNLTRNLKVNIKGKSFAWAIAHFLDSYVQYIFSLILTPGKMLIYDRFFYDYYVSFTFLRVPGYNRILNFAPRVMPTIVLIGDPKESFRRKPENTLEYFEYSHEYYKKLSREMNFILIDTKGKTKDEVFNEFIDKINYGL